MICRYRSVDDSGAAIIKSLDVLVLCSEQIRPMTIVECKPIGVLKMTDSGMSDEKIIAVPINDPNYNTYEDVSELPSHRFEEIKHFFEVYKTLEHDHTTTVSEICDNSVAREIIANCIDRYIEYYQR